MFWVRKNQGNNTENTPTSGGEMSLGKKILAIPLSGIGLAKVVPSDEAHVVVGLFGGRKEYSSRPDNTVEELVERQNEKSETVHEVKYIVEKRTPNPVYFRFPRITKIQKIPLSNLRIDVESIKLNDKNMAKFECNTICFVRVNNPVTASERTVLNAEKDKYETGNTKISADFQAILSSIARTVATQQTILEIYTNREVLQRAMLKQLADVAPRWGIALVDLEIQNIHDAKDSTIIADIERKQAAVIKADAEVKVAEEDKRARIVKAEAGRDALVAEATAEEVAKTRQQERDQNIGIATQKKEQAIAVEAADANAKKVDAERKTKVGNAEISRDVTVTNAEAEKQKKIKEAEATQQKLAIEADGEATKIMKEGTANAEITRVTGVAKGDATKAEKLGEAAGIAALADSQKKYIEGGLPAKAIDAYTQIEIKRAEAGAKIAENARINVISGNSEELMNGGLLGKIALGPREGAGLAQFLQVLGLTNKDMEKLGGAITDPKEFTKALGDVARDMAARQDVSLEAAKTKNAAPEAPASSTPDTGWYQGEGGGTGITSPCEDTCCEEGHEGPVRRKGF
jgi:regulator of protease activity HflC (stomatin/prohibitin superfamily)